MATLPRDPVDGMILRFFRRQDARRRTVETLHLRINEAARAPGLYLALGVPDTVEGRFEALCLHVILVLRRLKRLPAPAGDVGQDLVDSVFAQLDASLRELGVGDVSVLKRMKKLGAAFYGRAGGYDAALDANDEEALAARLARNVLGTERTEAAIGLARYVMAAHSGLQADDLDALLRRGPRFPAPEAFGGHGGPT